jgi:hypothetical protein
VAGNNSILNKEEDETLKFEKLKKLNSMNA